MTPLRGLLHNGQVNLASAALAGAFLEKLHRMELPESPFWGSKVRDRNHWCSLLQELEDTANSCLLRRGFPDLRRDLVALCKDNFGDYVLHLDFGADNLAFGPGTVFVTNFERCGCFGDPAFDLATLVVDYLCSDKARSNSAMAGASIRAFLTGYQGILDEPAKLMLKRISIYAAFLMLSRIEKNARAMTRMQCSQQLKRAIRILRGVNSSEATADASRRDRRAMDACDWLWTDTPENIFASNASDI
jgi:Ser/Thr protein kinase RdoA (MazF antagonist)